MRKGNKNGVSQAYADRFGITLRIASSIIPLQLTLCKSDEARRLLLGVSQ